MSTVEIEAAALDIPGVRAAAVLPPDAEPATLVALRRGDGLTPTDVLLAARGPSGADQGAARSAACVPELPLTPQRQDDRKRLRPASSRTPRRPSGPLADRARRAADLAELAGRYGTPLYVYDLARVRGRVRDLRAALPGRRRRIYYSLKANPHPDARAPTLRRGGCRRGGQLHRRAAPRRWRPDAAPRDLLYTGPGKTAGELAEAVAPGCGSSPSSRLGDLERSARRPRAHGVVADCLLRINAAAAPRRRGPPDDRQRLAVRLRPGRPAWGRRSG